MAAPTTCPSGAPEASAARYEVGSGALRLVIEADQPTWCPEFDGQTRVSSLQTGVFAGPVGGPVGQSRFTPGLVVRQAKETPGSTRPSTACSSWSQGDRRSPLHGGAVDDRVRGRARPVGGDLHPARSSAATWRPTGPASGWACVPSGTRGSATSSPSRTWPSTPATSTSTRPSGHPGTWPSSSTTSWSSWSSSHRAIPCSSCSTSTSSPRTSRRSRRMRIPSSSSSTTSAATGHTGEQRVSGIKVGCPPAEDRARTVLDEPQHREDRARAGSDRR